MPLRITRNVQCGKQDIDTAQNSKQICKKLNEGDISGVVRIASSDATFLPPNPETLEVHRPKHSRIETPNLVLEREVQPYHLVSIHSISKIV